MERKKIVRKKGTGRKKSTRSWLAARRLIPFLLLLLLLLFSLASAGYMIFFHATPLHVAGVFSPGPLADQARE